MCFFQKLHLPPKRLSTLLPTLSLSDAPKPSSLSSPLLLDTHFLLASRTPDLRSLLRNHALVVISGRSANPFFAAKLVSLYAAFRRPDLAARVFSHAVDQNPGDSFLWNSIIKTHFCDSNFTLSLLLYRQMLASGAPLNQFTIPMVGSACAELLELGIGACVHGISVKLGLFGGSGVGVGSSLVYMYSKCGVLGDAFRVFDEMPVRDVVSWTALIVGCVRNGECEMGLFCLREMHRVGGNEGTRPNYRTVEVGLQACGSLGALWEGKCLHGFSLKTGIVHTQSVKSSLLSMYSKCDGLEEVVVAFQDLVERDVVSWTAVVGVYARKGHVFECLELFRTMLDSGVGPDEVLVSCILACFMNCNNVYGGKAFHGVMLRKNFELDSLVGNALLSMYCKFELLDIAEKIFNTVVERDAESWNLMIFGFAKVELAIKCLDLFREMQFLGLGSDSDHNGLVSVISSCSQLEALGLGRSLHCYTIKNRLEGVASISNALVGMYGRCGKLDLARRIFDCKDRDVVTWNTLIAAYAHRGHSNDALALFNQMLLEDGKPNSSTLVSVLSACSHLAALHYGQWIHNYIKATEIECDVSLCTALIDMYAKCGQLETARAIFDSTPERDVVSWNVMISAYGSHGYAKEALEVFKEMQKEGMRPNGVSFLAVLSACSHSGLIEEGKELFDGMGEYTVSPTLKHYSCMVDLLARSGNLCEAEDMVLKMPVEPDGGIWGTLLGACKIHNNVEMGERIARKALELDPENEGYYTLMSNVYGSAGKWEEVEMLREMMKNQGVRKRTGWSAVEVGGNIHVLTASDISHSQSEEIYMVLEALCREMDIPLSL